MYVIVKKMNSITLKPIDKNIDPASVLPVLNTNSDFLEANAEKSEFTTADVEMFLYSESRRKNSQLLLITHKDETIIGVVASVAPQVGTLVLHKDHQRKGIGAEVVSKLEEDFKEKGFEKVTVNVLQACPGTKKFWESLGFIETNTTEDSNNRPVWVLEKTLK